MLAGNIKKASHSAYKEFKLKLGLNMFLIFTGMSTLLYTRFMIYTHKQQRCSNCSVSTHLILNAINMTEMIGGDHSHQNSNLLSYI